MQKTKKVQAGVSFAPEVMAYVDQLRESDEPLFRRRSRSDVINFIIEEHARSNGTQIVGLKKAVGSDV